MIFDKAMRTYCVVSLGLICGGVFAACAGSDTPPTDDQLEQDIATAYANGEAVAGGSGGAGGGSSAGAGGRASGGTGGRASGGTGGSGTGGTAQASEAGAGGTGAEAGGTGGSSSSGVCDGYAVLKAGCDGANCHGAGTGLDNFAESDAIARAFVGVDAKAPCSGKGSLLDPENPAQSVIVQKVAGAPPCGGPMPQGQPALSAADITCLQEWIGSLE